MKETDITINGFDELIDYLRRSDLEPKQIEQVISESLRVWCIGELTKEELIVLLIEYWEKWSDSDCRPLFINKDPISG